MEELKQLANTHPYWSLDDFAEVANHWLPRCLPEERANTRVREDVNPRLIRQYATWGLLDAPHKEGREARYTYRHLLQLLVTRRLLADGYATAVIHKLVAGQGDDSLEEMLFGGAMSAAAEASVNPAIAFLQGLTDRSRSAAPPQMSAPPMSAPPPAPRAPSPAPKKSAAPRQSSPPPALADAFQESALEKEQASYRREESAAPAYDAPSPPSPRRWMRLDVTPGLELNVRDDYRFPASPGERQALLDLIAQLLDTPHDR